MAKKEQIVKWEIGNDYAILQNQTISDIIVDDENYAYGKWNEKLVASFHIENGTWFVI